MAPSVTCHDHHLHGDHLLPTVHPTHSCLALSSASPLGVISGAASPLKDVDQKTSASVDVTEISINECSSPTLSILSEPGSMSAVSSNTVSSQTAPASHARPTPQRIRTVPPGSAKPLSPSGRRSGSCSTTHSTQASRRSSLHTPRPMGTNVSPTSTATCRKIPAEKREDLIALHREACRIFQTEDNAKTGKQDNPLHSPTSISTAYFSPHGGNSPDTSSPVVSPLIHPKRSGYFDQSQDAGPSHTLLSSCVSADDSPESRSRQASSAVIDWTSPSTRKREYAKIDRANRGFRGLWRRVAPKWCQRGERRTPFFEEGRDGKANYEGSVRRFRMDIPEEANSECGLDGPGRPFSLHRKRLYFGPVIKKRSRWPCVTRDG